MTSNPYRALPGVDQLLSEALSVEGLEAPRGLLLAALREDLDDARARIRDEGLDGEAVAARFAPEVWHPRVAARLRARAQPIYVDAINATGVVVHTGLGRAVLPELARERISKACGYTVLELERASGQRNRREDGVAALLGEITGAPGATVVNNNAAATLIALAALAKGREVIVARGQLVEIGGSFRIPDILEESGAKLVEVGATNRVHLRDYERALNERTGLILVVHPSNYAVVGFTKSVPLTELVALGRAHGVPVMDDLGSGCFLDLSPYGLGDEPRVQDSVEAGANVVTFSGDKLLGGPQAGLIIGDEHSLGLIRQHPLYRAMRPGKLTLAGLEAVLQLYRDPEQAREQLPVMRMITAGVDELERRAQLLAAPSPEADLSVAEDSSRVGGGAYAIATLPTRVCVVRPHVQSAGDLAAALRRNDPPIFTRVRDDAVHLDLRTVLPEQDEVLRAALVAALGATAE